MAPFSGNGGSAEITSVIRISAVLLSSIASISLVLPCSTDIAFGCQCWSKPKNCILSNQWDTDFRSQRHSGQEVKETFVFWFQAALPSWERQLFGLVLAWKSFFKEWLGECCERREKVHEGKNDLLNRVPGEICRLWDEVDAESWEKRLLKNDWGCSAEGREQTAKPWTQQESLVKDQSTLGESYLHLRLHCLL